MLQVASVPIQLYFKIGEYLGVFMFLKEGTTLSKTKEAPL